MLTLEHTDGYNYASIDLDKEALLWVSNNQKLGLRYLYGAGLGVIVPRSDVRLFGTGDNHYWNVSGWGISGKAGLIFDFSKHLFVEMNAKTGFTRLSNIPTTGIGNDKAKQSIGFLEGLMMLGVRI